MNRTAALCVLSITLPAAADLTYTADNRFIQAQTSLGQNKVKLPDPLFAPFAQAIGADSSQAAGSCLSTAQQDSTLGATSMSCGAWLHAEGQATAPSGVIFGGAGNSNFTVSFRPTIDSMVALSGTFTGTPGGSSFTFKVQHGATILYQHGGEGTFNRSVLLQQGEEYTVSAVASANALASFNFGPLQDTGDATLTFNALANTATCTGDLNFDDLVEDADFSRFAVGYDTLVCDDIAMTPGCPGDLNADGQVNDDDFVIFVVAYDALLCP